MTDHAPLARPVFLERRRILRGGGLAASALLLAACGEEIAPPKVPTGPTAPATPTPVATAEQMAAVVADVNAHVMAADQARDVTKLAPRVVGSAAEIRTRSYEILAKIPELAPAVPTPAATMLVPVVPTSGALPRTAIVVVADSADENAHFFMPLQLTDPRSVYSTWGWARQLAGVEMPSVANDKTGADAVAPDAGGLVLTPQDALARYAATLTSGDGADPDDLIAPDAFQQEVQKNLADERAKLNPNVPPDSLATISEEYTVVPGEFAAVRSADGGAIVMGSMRSSRRIALVNGATLTTKEDELRLAGSRTFTKEIVRDYAETVALFIPTADSGKKIQPIAASKLLLGAHGD